MGSPKIPPPVPPPAARPERKIEVEADDIQLGGSDTLHKDPSLAGKRALTRPRGGQVVASSAKSGVKV